MKNTMRINGNSLYELFTNIGKAHGVYSIGPIDATANGFTCVVWIK